MEKYRKDTTIVMTFNKLTQNQKNIVNDYLNDVGIVEYDVETNEQHTIIKYEVDTIEVDVEDVLADNKYYLQKDNVPLIKCESYPNY